MIDSVVIEFDKALRTLFCKAPTFREVPGQDVAVSELSVVEKERSAALMRVNHVGEICAQALYQGQAIGCGDPGVRQALVHASVEETEHLAWTERRINELGGRKSWLNPVWYVGALSFGVFAGKLGEEWSLGFLAETERQVEVHLDSHLSLLPEADARSRSIVAQMKIDEVEHAKMAERLGARELPGPVKLAMRLAAKVMTTLAYRV